MGLVDYTGITPIRRFSHIKVVRRNHHRYGQTGTVIRINEDTNKVWVVFPDGSLSQVGRRSLEVIVPRRA